MLMISNKEQGCNVQYPATQIPSELLRNIISQQYKVWLLINSGPEVDQSRSGDVAGMHLDPTPGSSCCARGASASIQPASSDDIQIDATVLCGVVANKKRP